MLPTLPTAPLRQPFQPSSATLMFCHFHGGPVSSPFESADLLLKLYELRRDPAMREARAWFTTEFNPTTFEDVQQALYGPKSAQFRMVSSYWDMAASFVNN